LSPLLDIKEKNFDYFIDEIKMPLLINRMLSIFASVPWVSCIYLCFIQK